MVTSPPNENRTIGGDGQSIRYVGLFDVGDSWSEDNCIGDAGTLLLLNLLTSNADKLLWRFIIRRDGGS